MVASLFLAAALQAGSSRVAFARFELSGPMQRAVLAPSTHLSGSLLRGERVERTLAVVVPELGPRTEPRWRWEADPEHEARARFLGWEDTPLDVPPGLRLRPRPPAEPHHLTPSIGLGCLLAALALATGLVARRSPRAVPGLALAGAALAWWLGGGGAAQPASERRLLEGVLGSDEWLEVRAAWEELELLEAGPIVVSSLPESAPLEVEQSLAAPGPLRLRARGATIHVQRRAAPPGGPLTASGQGCTDFDEVWRREQGEWTFHGTWLAGTALPAPRTGPPPPGWLALGLPQGPEVILGRATVGNLWFRCLGP